MLTGEIRRRGRLYYFSKICHLAADYQMNQPSDDNKLKLANDIATSA